jgi:L-ascorbate metabolism protein UlaG (beta-lactamase superfamily)
LKIQIDRRKFLKFGIVSSAFSHGNTLALKQETNMNMQEQKDWILNSKKRVLNSPQFKNGKFVNSLEEKTNQFSAFKTWLFTSKKDSTPTSKIPTVMLTKQSFETTPKTDLRIVWLSHSTLLIEIEGKRFLTDPVWGERASPVSFAGPKRFFEVPLSLSELPPLDGIILSHDHYDHMCQETFDFFKTKKIPIFTALGVGERLVNLGVPHTQVNEFDWWETHNFLGSDNFSLVCTPARHFSGRTLFDRNKTLWTSWCLLGAKNKVFFSGDTAMFPGFKEIGNRFGEFDLAAIEMGAYNPAWADVHIGPEQAVQAALDLKTKLLLPIHWATFDLSLHSWTEPVERLIVAAQKTNLPVAFPKPGEMFEPKIIVPTQKWWPDIYWQTAQEAPLVSSGV